MASRSVVSRLLSASLQTSRSFDVLLLGVDDVAVCRRAVHAALVAAHERHVLRHAHSVLLCPVDENECVSCGKRHVIVVICISIIVNDHITDTNVTHLEQTSRVRLDRNE